MSRSSRALRATLVVSVFGYSAQALSLVAVPLFLGTLGAEGYGLMVTVMAFMGYLGFADAGLSWGSMILIAQAHGRGGRAEIAHIVRHSVVLALGSALVVALAVGVLVLAAAAGWRLPMFADHPEAVRLILIGSVQLGLTLQFSVFYNVFQGLQESDLTGVYQGAGRLLGLACAMVAAWLTRSIEIVMLVQLAATTLSGAAAVLHVRRRHPWAFAAGSWSDLAQYRAQLRIGGGIFLLQIGRTLSGTAPTLGISSILGPAAVPLYTVPATLLSMFFMPINSWNGNILSAYSEAWASGDRDWVRNAFRKSIERALVLGGLGVALFLGLGDGFVRLWTHHRLWIEPATAASVSAIVVCGTLLAAGQFLLTGLNRHRHAAMAETANGLLATLLVPAAVYFFGIGGVGVGVVVATLATSAWVLRREISAQLGSGSWPTPQFTLKVSLALAIGAGTAGAIGRLPETGEISSAALRLLLGVLLGSTVFLAVTVALKLIAIAEVGAVWRRLKLRPATQAL